MDDAGKLVGWLRERGEHDDAERLASLLEYAQSRALDVALLIGGYYLAVKFRGGRLAFMWGWNAAGALFARKLARLERLLPSTERALSQLTGEVRRVARRHPQLAGAGLDWEDTRRIR